MADRLLSTRTLNRALLARQFLLERGKLTIPRTVERVGGLQTQYAPSAYIGLWSRLDGFQRSHLTRALEKGQVIQGTVMRVTIHIVSGRDYPLLTEAVRQSRRDWWLRVARGRDLDEIDFEEIASLLRAALTDGPRTRKELIEVLVTNGFPKELWEGAGLWLDMVRVPPSGTWERRRADIYGLADDWVEVGTVTEEAGIEHLIRRYLGAFGPASVGDIASWGGIPITTLRPILGKITLRTFRSEDGGELIDLPRQPIPDPGTPAPVRFLPTWDATLLAHARRTQILAEEYRSEIFNTKNPQSLSTFLVDGAVAGTWRSEAGAVRIEPFAPLPRNTRRDLEEEAIRLAGFVSD